MQRIVAHIWVLVFLLSDAAVSARPVCDINSDGKIGDAVVIEALRQFEPGQEQVLKYLHRLLCGDPREYRFYISESKVSGIQILCQREGAGHLHPSGIEM